MAFFSATQLPLVVAITTIATEQGHMRSSTAAALVGAAILSTLIFPFVGLALRRRDREPAVSREHQPPRPLDATAGPSLDHGTMPRGLSAPRVAVVGHVEWIEFARVEHAPAPGEIVHARETWQEVGGGGAVAAVQLARLAGECLFLTALGDDSLGQRSKRELEALGVRVVASWRSEPQRRAFVHLDAGAERTITVMGKRVGPRREDPLPWSELDGVDAVYFTAGDAGAVRAARAARNLVSTVRAIESLAEASVPLDALVSSAKDEGERYAAGEIEPTPALVVRTGGAAGGQVIAADGRVSEWKAAPLPGPPVDSYGAGDCFAAGLTYALGEGRSPQDALELAARAGAASMTGRGPYEGQLRTADNPPSG